MEDVSTAPALVNIRIDWSEIADAHAYHVNQALGQVGPPGGDGLPDGIYVTMGNVAPPALLEGDTIASSQLLERLTTIGAKVNIACQVHMTRQMLGELITVLQTTAVKYDAAVRQVTHGHAGEQGDSST